MSNHALAAEMRGLLADLSARRLDEATAATLAHEVRRLRSMVEGPRRAKWYDPEDPSVSASDVRRSFAEMSLYRGELNPMAPPLRYSTESIGGVERVVATVRCGAVYEGPPGGVHGGYVAGLFDDVLGRTIALIGGGAVTGRLDVRYRRVTPIEADLRFVAWVDHDRGRRIVSKAHCFAGETFTAEAEALFVRVDYGDIERQSRELREAAR